MYLFAHNNLKNKIILSRIYRMASVYNFTFDNLTGLNDDSCSISEKEVQNNNYGNYSVQSYFLHSTTQSNNVTTLSALFDM